MRIFILYRIEKLSQKALMHSCVKPWLFILLAGIHVYSWTAEHQKTTHTKSVHLSQRTRSSGDGKEDEEDAHFKKIAIPVGITVAALIAAGLYANSHGYFDRAKEADQDSLKDPDELTRKQPLFNVQPSGVRRDSSPKAVSSSPGSSTSDPADKPAEEKKDDSDSDEEETPQISEELKDKTFYPGKYFVPESDSNKYTITVKQWDQKRGSLWGTFHHKSFDDTAAVFGKNDMQDLHLLGYCKDLVFFSSRLHGEIDYNHQIKWYQHNKPHCFAMLVTDYPKLATLTRDSKLQLSLQEMKVNQINQVIPTISSKIFTRHIRKLIQFIQNNYLPQDSQKLIEKLGNYDWSQSEISLSDDFFKLDAMQTNSFLRYFLQDALWNRDTLRDSINKDDCHQPLVELMRPDLVITPAITAS